MGRSPRLGFFFIRMETLPEIHSIFAKNRFTNPRKPDKMEGQG